MRHFFPLCLLAACTLPAAACASSPPPSFTKSLPASAHLLQERRVPGYRQGYAVLYQTGAQYLGVVLRGRLLWKRKLTGHPGTIATPGPTGLFQVVLTLPGQAGQEMEALRLAQGAVSSGIAANPSGSVTASEGVTVKPKAFVTRAKDTAHMGSVPYRFVTRYSLCSHIYCVSAAHREPDYAPADYPKPNGVVKAQSGDTILMRLEVAADAASQEKGLMFRKSLDPDSGMVFVWDQTVEIPFWMENTYIPLTVAFLAPDGTIQEMQDMAPLTETLHQPAAPYQYAIEMNQGFFAKNGIEVGDKVALALK